MGVGLGVGSSAAVGDLVGDLVGRSLGGSVGALVGDAVGSAGQCVGPTASPHEKYDLRSQPAGLQKHSVGSTGPLPGGPPHSTVAPSRSRHGMSTSKSAELSSKSTSASGVANSTSDCRLTASSACSSVTTKTPASHRFRLNSWLPHDEWHGLTPEQSRCVGPTASSLGVTMV